MGHKKEKLNDKKYKDKTNALNVSDHKTNALNVSDHKTNALNKADDKTNALNNHNFIIYRGKVKHLNAFMELLTDKFYGYKMSDLIKRLEQSRDDKQNA